MKRLAEKLLCSSWPDLVTAVQQSVEAHIKMHIEDCL